jgi:hypothetical protein
MPVIDADTHVRECDDTFSYMAATERQCAPAKGETPGKNGGPPRGCWMVGGQPMGRTIFAEGDYWKTMGELLNVDARVRTMDVGRRCAGGLSQSVIEISWFARS